jgi:hypothetical protein
MTDAEQTPQEIAAAELARREELFATARRLAGSDPGAPTGLDPEINIAPEPEAAPPPVEAVPIHEPPTVPTQTQTMPATPTPTRPKSRAEVAAMREAERNAGVKYWLPITQDMATVRDLPFTDWVMLQGIPVELRGKVDAAIRDADLRNKVRQAQEEGVAAAHFSVEDAVATMGTAEDMANAICCAAFIDPELVLNESELDPNNPRKWLVTDLHIDERTNFLIWMQRNRAATVDSQGGAAATAGFQGARVERLTDSAASDQVREAAG